MYQLPLSNKRRTVIVSFLERHIRDIDSALSNRVQRIRQSVAQWEARSKSKNFPWPGASSIRAPIEAIVRDAINARLLNALQAQDRDFVLNSAFNRKLGVPNPSRPNVELDTVAVADAVERYMLLKSGPNGTFDFRKFQSDGIEEMTMTGTLASSWTWERSVARTGDGIELPGEGELNAKIIYLENLLFAKGYESFDRCPFVGVRVSMRPSEIRDAIDTHGWRRDDVTAYLRDHVHSSSEPDDVDPLAAEYDDVAFDNDERWLVEAWCRIPLDGRSLDSEEGTTVAREHNVVLTFPLDHPEYLFSFTNWHYEHGALPFPTPAPYIKRRNRILGMGIPERVQGLANGFSTTLNQIIDASTLANVPVFSVNENVPSLRQLSNIYPGKVIHRGDDPNNFRPEKLGNVGPDIFNALNSMRVLIEQVSKVSDFNLGRESSVTNQASTATTTLALLAENGQYFENITREARKHFTHGLNLWFAMIVQNQPITDITRTLGPIDGQVVATAIRGPVRDVLRDFYAQVSFSSTAATRELSRQEEMAKFTLLQSYYQALVEMAQLLITNPLLKPLLDDIARSADQKIRGILETFGESVSTSMLPDWQMFSDYAAQVSLQLGALNGNPTDQSGRTPQGDVPSSQSNREPTVA